MYVPNPIRCRKCLRLGHFSDNCLKEPICGFCSKPEHNGKQCDTFVPQCVNCKGTHHSLDIKCPKFVQEKDIKSIQFREKITYSAAKKLYRETQPITFNKTYAEVARNSRKGIDVGCQTDVSLTLESNVNDLRAPSSSIASSCTGLTLQQPPSIPQTLTPPLPSPSTPPSPHSVPFPPTLTSSTHKHSATEKQSENITSNCKTLPLPQRNPSNKNRKKLLLKKGENNKSGDEMEVANI